MLHLASTQSAASVAPSPQIHLAVHKCARGFRDLITAVAAIPRFAAQTRPETINDELDHFKIWVGNIAAHRQGRRSLEYRLRDAAHLKSEVNDLLQVLQKSLAKALAIVNGERIPWDEESDSDSDSESDLKVSDDAGNENPKNDTELKHIFITIKSTVTCLFRLSMAIRDPAPNTQLRNFITVDKSYFETYDISHVQSKFPQAEVYLTERLGRAMTGRRRYLTYREEHHQKLSKNVEEIGHEGPSTEYTTNSTEASLLPVANGKTVIDDSFDILSQTSHATSVNATIRVPALPKQAWDNEQWECPLCYLMVSIHTTAGWKQHVYRDLHPYCCTFEDCTIADRLYDSRRNWFQHELGHRKYWQCIEGCNRSFSCEKDFVAHVQAQHPELTAPNVLTALKNTATRSANLSDQGKCSLCNKSMTLRILQKHLGRHQQQLALFALPQNMDETGDGREDGESQASVDVNKWQDEELSDISDTAHFGEDIESEVEDPLPWGATPETALGKLAAIALHLHTELVPPIMAFMQQQPAEESARILEHKKLSERVLTETLMELDAVETENNPDARTRRKELSRETQDLLNRLDEARRLVCKHTTCGKMFNSSADLRRHYEEMHGENGESLDITQERKEQKRKDIGAQIKAEEEDQLFSLPVNNSLNSVPSRKKLSLSAYENRRHVLAKEEEDLMNEEMARIKDEEARLKFEWDLKTERDERIRKESRAREDTREQMDHSARGRQQRIEDDWAIDDEIAELRLEIAKDRQERSKIASGYEKQQLHIAHERTEEQDEALQLQRREELIKKKMELKYITDKQERQEEENRIKIEEDRMKKDWEVKCERDEQKRESDEAQVRLDEDRLNHFDTFQQHTPALPTRHDFPYLDFTTSTSAAQLSPLAQPGVTLYSPAMHLDEGFGDEMPTFGRPSDDFTLFGSTASGSMGMNATAEFFPEINQDMNPMRGQYDQTLQFDDLFASPPLPNSNFDDLMDTNRNAQ